MHVLLLALNYHPDKLGNAPLMVGMCEGLVRRGHRVSVVCAFPHHETGRIEGPYRSKLFQRDRHNGVDILRTYIYAPEGGTLAKMANYASFTAMALAAAATVRGVDVIFTPSPPLTLGLVDHALASAQGIPFVYNLQDLFPEAAVRLGVLKNPRMIAGFERLERFVYAKADHLAVISEGFRDHVLARGVPADKVTVIPNYTDADLIQPGDRASNPFRARLRLDGRFVIQFSGRMGYSQGLEFVLEAFKLLADLPDVHLMLVGDGQARSMVEERVQGDPRISLLPTQPRERLSDLLAAADVGLAPLRRGMAGTSVPSKIFGIMASARPVVAAVEADSDTAKLLADSGCGLAVPPEDPAALAAALRRLHADRALTDAMGARGREHVVAHYGQEATVSRYERLLQAVVARGRG